MTAAAAAAGGRRRSMVDNGGWPVAVGGRRRWAAGGGGWEVAATAMIGGRRSQEQWLAEAGVVQEPLISGGTDTTAITLTWALSLLLNNRHVLKQAQLEQESHIGRERQVTESDIKDLVYLQAIVKETLRLYPATSLSVPHESVEDCTIGGYHVPAGMWLLFNISKLHRDPRVWPDPLKFRPERFLTTHKDLDVRGQNFEYLPFRSGRRMCPGVTFALQVLHIALATLLHSFDSETVVDGPVDMRAGMGITSPKVTPLEVILTPRLPLHLCLNLGG
ncbi:xanthotoxin 5-hydroxylase CYP82C4-like [Rhodamnia argentea]|uniref:Xanthotoxin 5-hydroxylase CYP82C4-like n=1 Tax=Rhodamnia argentea TaxID=178133 RepID=A0A8B8MPE8_9MYRT|nr:xanthotoxin 5-hydroxylase CYP82C4-like [Rhodamnia argentea]